MLPQETVLPPRRKILTLFFQLIRWPNLVFILLTQVAFQCCILKPWAEADLSLSPLAFFLVTLSYSLIAAGGYIINDYFDLDIDLINKPDKVFIGREISKRSAYQVYILINSCAIAVALMADILSHTFMGTISLLICIGLLYWYSASLKKSFLVGNFIVAGVTAWSVPVLYLLQYKHPGKEAWLAAVYFSFAFVISLVREMVKDIEDARGDEALGCRTMPIVWGIPRARVFTLAWLCFLAAMILASLGLLIWWKYWLGAAYALLFLAFPMVILFRGLVKATQASDYHKLSTRIKLLMALGILSMVLFLWPA